MSGVRTPTHTPGLLAGRWQIPLALAAAAIGGATLYKLVPAPHTVNFDALLADVTALEQAGDTSAAADGMEAILALNPPPPPESQAILHDRLAALIYHAERDLPEHSASNARKILAHDRAARELGCPATPTAALRDAFALHWLGEHEAALRGFREALDLNISSDERRTCLRELVQLLEHRPDTKLQRQAILDRLLADESVSPDFLWWSLHRSVQDALDENDTPRARQVLERYGDRLKNSDLEGYLDYLQALVMLHEGRPEQAAPLVRWIDDWLGQDARSTAEMDNFGHLPSLNRWLMGRVDLAEDRPQEALASFEEALRYRPSPELRVAAGIGRGQALAGLDRHSAALEAFRSVESTAPAVLRRPRMMSEFQHALLELFERQRARGDFGNAVGYLSLATELSPSDEPEQQRDLFEQLAEAHQAAAASTSDPALARANHEQAARSYERAADLDRFDEPRLAELLWSAADEYDQAGHIADVRRVLQRFVRGRSEHPRMPQALLQLGRASEALGDPEAALNWYERVRSEFPRLGEAARARALTAGVLIALGPSRYPEAERILADLLTNDSVAPDAAVYRDALLSLSELLNYEGRHAEAISRLEDFLRLYPQDPEHLRARFMVADAYRASAYALRDNPPADAAAPTAAAESRRRLHAAADLYGQLLSELETVTNPDAKLELYARLALLYRGDCLFDLNEPDTLRAALDTYRRAAVRYEGHPTALTAQVQIANVLLRQGDLPEAARAVEGAQWLLRGIPAAAFTRLDGGSPTEWERFLSVVAASDLIQNAFVSTP